MVDFSKLGTKDIEKKIHPIDIYDSLDRSSETGPLRPAQEYILKHWFDSKQEDKNLIVKLHTGQGKTLIGLLMLLSKLNNEKTPCLYVCPNIYLAHQTIEEAKKFGIPQCRIGADGEIPDEFLNGEKILITHVQKVFNGKTKFGLDNQSIPVKNIVLDDSHACIDSLKSSFTIIIKKDEELYGNIISLFESDLIHQGEGTFLDIIHGKYASTLPIPYWSWAEKKAEVLKLLSEEEDNTSVSFAWPLMKDNIINYRALISGNHIELTPYHVPIHHFGSFNDAEQRILMSATTQDDAFFVKGLGFDSASITTPLIEKEQKWSGEKMILLPSLIDDSLNRDLIVNELGSPLKKRIGFVSLVPNFRMSEQYEALGALIAKPENIYKVIQTLKAGQRDQTAVIVNRYDGIDLPDGNCRVLIFDSKPFFISLADRYEESCRKSSDAINVKLAQKIEQGLGRSVRGEKDYSVIIMIGGDLVKFVKSSVTNKYFSPQTRQQIMIGLNIVKAAKADLESEDSPYKVVTALMKQSVDREPGWKQYYTEQMETISDFSVMENNLLELFEIESAAELAHYNGNSEKAVSLMQNIVDNYCDDDSEKGWYLQQLARYKLNISSVESNKLQISAFKKNYQLIHPKEGITYSKLSYMDGNRLMRINAFLKSHSSYEELLLSIDDTLAMLNFGIPAENFESALYDLGIALGFASQRPDKEYKKGPDNLWCGVGDKYILMECKSEVKDSRNEINKHEASQMNSHCAWFRDNYEDKQVKNILIIPTKNLSYHANFGYPVQVMRKGKLRSLRTKVKDFFKEFRSYDLQTVTEEKIQEFLVHHELQIDDLMTKYSEDYFHRTS